jgi:hypothetical protein
VSIIHPVDCQFHFPSPSPSRPNDVLHSYLPWIGIPAAKFGTAQVTAIFSMSLANRVSDSNRIVPRAQTPTMPLQGTNNNCKPGLILDSLALIATSMQVLTPLVAPVPLA